MVITNFIPQVWSARLQENLQHALVFGNLCNRNYEVWDYRDQTGNFLGQICPMFTLLWIPVSLMALFLHELLSRRVDRISIKRCAYL